MIKAIIFDCFGVLTTDLWKEFVATLPKPQQAPAYDINHAYDRGFITHKEYLEQLLQLTGRKLDDIAYVERGKHVKNTALLAVITQLKTDYKIGLISNIATNWIRESLLTPQEQELFDAYTLSFEVHLTKPDLEMFRLGAQRLGVEPSECVMVDDLPANCAAARQAGMQAIEFTTTTELVGSLAKLLPDFDDEPLRQLAAPF